MGVGFILLRLHEEVKNWDEREGERERIDGGEGERSAKEGK
jgi:hypothetical protein